MVKHDYLVVGSGLFGAVFAHEMKKAGKSVLLLEKRAKVGGNIRTDKIEGIDVHVYGAHIFHTNQKPVWDYVNEVTEFRPMSHAPVANYKGEIYSLPFNMYTFYAMWGVRTPKEARAKLAEQQAEYAGIAPRNLEEQALKLVGHDIYEKLIKGYTEKQWGRKCTDLPAFIIRRLPVRLNYNNSYFNDMYQGIPKQGYTHFIEKLLEGIEVRTGIDFLEDKQRWESMADKVVFTGRVDAYFEECFGPLEYRSLRFDTRVLEEENYQGIAVMNYTSADEPYTRVIEHKHFMPCESDKTVVTWEYSQEWNTGVEPYYPVNDEKNSALYTQYEEKAKSVPNVLFGGRLGTYRYCNMDQIVEQALEMAGREKLNS